MIRTLNRIVVGIVLLLVLGACRTSPTNDTGWRLVTTAPTARGELAASVADGHLYVLGGLTGLGDATDLVEVYEFDTHEWRTAADLPQPRNHHATASLDGKLYVVGGSTSFDAPALVSASVYDPADDSWTAIPDMPEPRWAAGAAAVDGKLYVVGGTGGEDNAQVLIYDPGTDTWTTGAPIPTIREHLAVVAFDGRVYAFGGRSEGSNLDTAKVYDPPTDPWSELSSLPTARSGLAAAVAGERIVVAGGENPSVTSGEVFPEVEIYDPTGDTWSVAPPLPTPRHGLAGAGYAGTALFIGGAGRQGALSPTAWSGVVEGYRPETAEYYPAVRILR